jgi:ABC-2 type transport system permease protein
MSAQAMRTVRALWWGWKAEFSGAAEYRADLVSGTVVSATWLGLSISPMLVVSSHSQAAPGWTLPRLLFLQAVWYLLDGVLWMIIMNNARDLSDLVHSGRLDALLLKPVNSLLLCTLGSIYVQDAPKIILALALGVGAVVAGGGPASLLAAASAMVAIACACALMWAAGVLANFKAITQVQFDGMFALHAAHNLARVPTPLYGPVLHVLFTVVIPIGFLTTVPAELFFGTLHPAWVLGSIALTAGCVALTSRLWHRELRGYTGAMG